MIRIQGLEPRQQLARDELLGELGRILRFGAPAGLHGVNEVGGFRVAEIGGEGGDVEGHRHVVVLVDEVVAVEHVDAVPGGVFSQHVHPFVIAKEDNVFETRFLVSRDCQLV